MNIQLQIAAIPSVLCCHLANTNEELGRLATAISPVAKLRWSLFLNVDYIHASADGAAAATEPVVATVAAEVVQPSSKSSTAAGAPRIDISDESTAAEKIAEKIDSLDKYELHDRDAEIADRVAAVLRSARLQVGKMQSFIFWCHAVRRIF